jgi:hypothetical protein
MNALSDFEPDEHALMKKPRPVGWFFAGLGALATLTLGFGYFMPLSGAHETLVAEHEKLAQKSRELDHALKESQKSLKETEAGRSDLRQFIDGAAQTAQGNAAVLRLASATAENELKPFISSKLVTMEVQPRGLVYTFADKVLFRGETAATSPQARIPLCKAVGGLTAQKTWVVRSTTRASKDDKKSWATAGERAGNLGGLLEASCKISPERILSAASGLDEDGGESGKTEIVVGPPLPPLTDFDKAPQVPVAGN